LYHFGYDSDAAARTLHIADLYVDRGARQLGVGTALMKSVGRIAREAGAGELIWSVYRGNNLATKFYEKLGAQLIADVFFMKLEADRL
jgi:GNAT superfamily N-acetyltransferase